ncbi:carbohydrate ABC transporter permease [Salinirubellus sp. GCM10025818]|jgi:multiple sugar transport system permease protein|uniref:carbohydrate ABC transporter permease n=1 Tax=Salinirubellus TaxID=2162630 RepID=UPI0030CA95C6
MSQASSDETYERISYQTRQRFGDIVESPYAVHLVAIIAALTVLIPLLWALSNSFKANEAIYNLNYLPAEPTLDTYRSVLFGEQYWKAVLNTFIISTTTTIAVVVLAVPAGYAFSRFRFPFDDYIFIGILFSRLFPPIGLIVPYFQVLSTANLLNTKTGIIIANIYLWLPLMIYLMRNFFISIPKALDESALVDGCTRFQAFLKVGIPLARPGIAAVAILTFLYSWREFLFALIVSSDLTSQPLSVAVFSFVGDVSIYWASLSAASIIAILPTVLIVIFFQQYIVSGLTSGAMKG